MRAVQCTDMVGRIFPDPPAQCVCACVRARVCVHAYSRGSLRSEVDAIQDVLERYERAATLSWRRLCLDEVVETRCVLRLMKEAAGASPEAQGMMHEEATARMRSRQAAPSVQSRSWS